MSRRQNARRAKQRGEAPADDIPATGERPAPAPHPPTRRPWFLATAIAMEAVWLVFLLVLALRS